MEHTYVTGYALIEPRSLTRVETWQVKFMVMKKNLICHNFSFYCAYLKNIGSLASSPNIERRFLWEQVIRH